MNTHDLRVMICIPLSASEVGASLDGPVTLTSEMMARPETSTSIGCYRCEEPVAEALVSPICPGEPLGYEQDGTPIPRRSN